MVLPWLMLAVLPLPAASGLGVLLSIVSLHSSCTGWPLGIEDANDTGYRQSVAPDAIQGRMNSTIRTMNRAVFFFGALLTGAMATFFGYRLTLGVGAVVFAAAAVVVLLSPLRTARNEG